MNFQNSTLMSFYNLMIIILMINIKVHIQSCVKTTNQYVLNYLHLCSNTI